MKPLSLVVIVSCLAYCYADETGCKLLNGYLSLKENEVFSVGETCLRFRCIKDDQFKVSMGCETRWRGAPTDHYKKEIAQLAQDVKNGRACGKAYNIDQ